MTARVTHVAFCPICGQVSPFCDDEAKAERYTEQHNRSNHSNPAPQIYEDLSE